MNSLIAFSFSQSFKSLLPLMVYADSCEDVVIENCYICVGDDGVAIKSGWDQYGIAYGRPSTNILIRNLTVRSVVRWASLFFLELFGIFMHFKLFTIMNCSVANWLGWLNLAPWWFYTIMLYHLCLWMSFQSYIKTRIYKFYHR